VTGGIIGEGAIPDVLTAQDTNSELSQQNFALKMDQRETTSQSRKRDFNKPKHERRAMQPDHKSCRMRIVQPPAKIPQ